MKKLLSILAAVGLTATASTTVVACGSTKKSSTDGNNTKPQKPSADGTVSTSFVATFNKKPTNEELSELFAIKDSEGNAVKDATYKFEETTSSIKAFVLSEGITGKVTVTFNATDPTAVGKKATFNIDLSEKGKSEVKDFKPVSVSVDEPNIISLTVEKYASGKVREWVPHIWISDTLKNGGEVKDPDQLYAIWASLFDTRSDGSKPDSQGNKDCKKNWDDQNGASKFHVTLGTPTDVDGNKGKVDITIKIDGALTGMLNFGYDKDKDSQKVSLSTSKNGDKFNTIVTFLQK